MAYLWPQSLVPWLDPCGDPYAGARAFFFNAGTTTPKVTYTDSGLNIPHDHPVVAGGAGRFTAIFLTGGDYRVRIETADGVVIEDVDGISIPDVDGGGGGGGDTPIEKIFQTGDVKFRYDVGSHDGWVRQNGLTIGNGVSGATERANDDTEALFIHLWNKDPNLAVSGGRGASAQSDFAANKAIALPDWRGRGAFGLASMGAAVADVIDNSLVDDELTNDTLGAKGGESRVVLTEAQLAEHTHSGTTSPDTHSHTMQRRGGTGGVEGFSFGNFFDNSYSSTSSVRTLSDTHDHEFVTDPAGESEPHSNMPPFALATWYIKL